ncbi:MAG: dephospho-CoA kinase [Desulfobulbus sp.]|nr:MAG: dephospho-CoA kinase [Desulfobulbus sp.]
MCRIFCIYCKKSILLQHKNARIIGITGGIGSGKSRVCRYLGRLCQMEVVDLDDICRKLLLPGNDGWQALKENIDSRFFQSDGELDRVSFRDELFKNKQFRNLVDSLLHPLAQKKMNHQLAGVEGMVLVEIPLLFEAGWQDYVDVIIVVYAEKVHRMQRIVNRDGVSEEQAGLAISAQYSLSRKASLAHYVVDNSGSWKKTCNQLEHLSEALGCKD